MSFMPRQSLNLQAMLTDENLKG